MSDDGLVATDRRLDERSLAVASRSLPFHPTVDADRSGMTVPLIGGLDVLPFHRIAARRNDHRGASAVVGDGVVGWFAVIGTIGGELADRTVDLVQ